ncbi:MAG TPA: hypothetical protein VI382_00855, partial [Candidatus Manganitrophaceae bacterium]|nr:hypothetical protein [Candidatus Manganitrophaceae bacterium]
MSNRPHEIRPKRLVFSAFLLIIGVVIGITLVSEFHLIPSGRAVNDPQREKPPAIAQTEQT